MSQQQQPPAAPNELELGRIRGLSRNGQYREALAAATELSAAAPESRDVIYLIAANQRCLDRIDDALATLERLERAHPRFSLLYQERGHCYARLRDAPRAIAAFLQGVDLNPTLEASWKMLERLYRVTGQGDEAATAAAQAAALEGLPAEVVRAGSLFSDNSLTAAEKILHSYPGAAGNAEALRLLGRIAHRRGERGEAEALLEKAVALAPEYRVVRREYTDVLIARQKYPQAREQADILLSLEPGNAGYLSLQAAASAALGYHDAAIETTRRLIAASPESANLHLALGHSLQSVGSRTEAVASYRTATALRPGFGDAYWSLANLKTYCFSADDIERMREAEAAADVDPDDRYHLCFALGKAHEDRCEYAESWKFYERGNAMRRRESGYDAATVEAAVTMQRKIFTAEFISARPGVGAPDPDPIFILGLPRSGSTLIEQILASHSRVEGTRELCEIESLVTDLGPAATEPDRADPDWGSLGRRYIRETRPYRRGKPFFIDKMPNNFRHIGLIHLILPNARIIDARREPMACCFSNLKQLFAAGQDFSYGIDEVARYYRSYLELMRHWDEVLPGRLLRVWHEDVVRDLEGNVRRILEFCGLDHEAACVEFYRTRRAVSTASSEQVRQPIFRDGLHQWRHYEQWLDPLRERLGDALTRYRE